MLVGWRRDPMTCRQLQIRDGDTSKLRDKGILRTVLNIIDIIAYKLLGMDVWEQTSTGRAVRTRATTPWQRARLRMRMRLQRQSQSFALTTASGNRDELCGPSNLVVGGQSCVLVMNVTVPTVVVCRLRTLLLLRCPVRKPSRLRERRLQDESSEILYDVTFTHTTSAVSEAATDVESHFESSVSETFNFTVEVAVTVTADDDNDDITVLPVVEEHDYTICRLGVGRRLGSSVACPRGAGRRLRRRITCRCGADWRMSPRVTCPSTKSCTAGTDSRVHALWRPRCLWQVTRLVGGDAEDRAEDLRADAGGGPSCGWRPTGASAAEVDPLQAQAIVEESVDCVMAQNRQVVTTRSGSMRQIRCLWIRPAKARRRGIPPDSERRIVSPDGCTKSRMPLDSRTKRTRKKGRANTW